MCLLIGFWILCLELFFERKSMGYLHASDCVEIRGQCTGVILLPLLSPEDLFQVPGFVALTH